MAHWDEEKKKQIAKWLGNNCRCEYVGIGDDGISTDEIIDNEKNRFDLIIGFNKHKNIFVVWNPYLHYFRKIYRVTISKSSYRKKFENISAVYSELKDGNSRYEKKLLIKPNFMECYCKNWKAFLRPDNSDSGFRKNVLWADKFQVEPTLWGQYCNENQELIIRDKICVARVKRDYTFRKRIFSKYENPCCCICRCEIPQLLEAAHIQAVSKNGDDSTDNGILLCRNHHKMYDEGLIGITGDSLVIYDDRVKEMPWYHEFIDKHDERILI